MRGLACTSALVALLAMPAAAEDLSAGEAEYLESCARCHGERGRGDGASAPGQTLAPTDLTLIGQKNGGEFPYWQVFAVIDGRFMVEAHGGRDMPVWGRHFLAEEKPRLGPIGGEAVAQARIHDLVAYIQSLQR